MIEWQNKGLSAFYLSFFLLSLSPGFLRSENIF